MVKIKDEYNRLLKVRIFVEGGGQFRLSPYFNRAGNQIDGKGSLTFRGTDKEFAKFLMRLQAKDNATDPPSSKGRTYMQMVQTARDGSDPYVWIWNTNWYKSNKFLTHKSRREKVKEYVSEIITMIMDFAHDNQIDDFDLAEGIACFIHDFNSTDRGIETLRHYVYQTMGYTPSRMATFHYEDLSMMSRMVYDELVEIFGYEHYLEKVKEETAILCPQCGKMYDKDTTQCIYCGEKLPKFQETFEIQDDVEIPGINITLEKGDKIVINVDEKASTKTAKCPECGGKYLVATGYCVHCKKKVGGKKEAAKNGVTLECQECGKVFVRKNPGANTKCPSCGGYDIDLFYGKKENVFIIKDDIEIPETDITLEKGDKIKVIEKIHKAGDSIKVPHKGKIITGKVVRYDKGDPHGSPFYIVDMGEEEKLSEGLGKRNYNFRGIDTLGEFWVVLEPTDVSEIDDILFPVDVFDFALQLRGGMKGNKVRLITKDENEAREMAEDFLLGII